MADESDEGVLESDEVVLESDEVVLLSDKSDELRSDVLSLFSCYIDTIYKLYQFFMYGYPMAVMPH